MIQLFHNEKYCIWNCICVLLIESLKLTKQFDDKNISTCPIALLLYLGNGLRIH